MDSRFIDEEAGIKCSGGDRELYRQILETYFKGVPDLRSRIVENQGRNINDYTIAVHALKSSSYSIGAVGLGDKAYQCELAGRAGEQEKVEELTGSLIEELDALVADLRAEFSKTEKPPVHQICLDGDNTEIVINTVGSLKEAVECFDSDEAEKLLGQLNEYSFSGRAAELMDQCREALECFDYDGVKECADSLLSTLQVNT